MTILKTVKLEITVKRFQEHNTYLHVSLFDRVLNMKLTEYRYYDLDNATKYFVFTNEATTHVYGLGERMPTTHGNADGSWFGKKFANFESATHDYGNIMAWTDSAQVNYIKKK